MLIVYTLVFIVLVENEMEYDKQEIIFPSGFQQAKIRGQAKMS